MREHILATGQRIMAGKGFSAVGLNEILKDAGIPKGSFYHYFGSKEAFGVAMLERYLRVNPVQWHKVFINSGRVPA